MARKRMIDPSFWEDCDLGELPPIARLLFIGMFANADDEGRIFADVRHLKRTIFGYDETSFDQIEGALAALVGVCRHLEVYETGGRRYAAFLKWSQFQYIQKPQPSKIPPPPSQPAPEPESHPQPTEMKPVTTASDNTTLPLSDPYDTSTIPVSDEYGLDRKEKNRSKREVRSVGDAAAPSPDSVKPIRPGVSLFREVFGRYPTKEFFPRFEAAYASVGESLMRRRLEEWRDNPRCGPTNYADMLRVATDGWRADRGGNGKPSAEKPEPWRNAL